MTQPPQSLPAQLAQGERRNNRNGVQKQRATLTSQPASPHFAPFYLSFYTTKPMPMPLPVQWKRSRTRASIQSVLCGSRLAIAQKKGEQKNQTSGE